MECFLSFRYALPKNFQRLCGFKFLMNSHYTNLPHFFEEASRDAQDFMKDLHVPFPEYCRMANFSV